MIRQSTIIKSALLHATIPFLLKKEKKPFIDTRRAMSALSLVVSETGEDRANDMIKL